MEKYKRILLKLLFPHKAFVVSLVIVSTIALSCVFITGSEAQLIAYVTYPLSFYSLCTVVVLIPGTVKNSKEKIYSIPQAARYFSEQELRYRISLYSSTAFNLAFGLFKLMIGILLRSVWFGAVGIYYMVLSLTRFFLIQKDYVLQSEQTENNLLQWKSYRTCGGFLLIINAAMSGIVFLCIHQNQSYVYPGFIIYASAAYTFYRMTIAIIQNIKLRNHNNPLFLAAKITDLSAALMSIFTLQTALLATFGSEADSSIQHLMNTLTGSAVCCIVVCIAIYMLVRASKEFKTR